MLRDEFAGGGGGCECGVACIVVCAGVATGVAMGMGPDRV